MLFQKLNIPPKTSPLLSLPIHLLLSTHPPSLPSLRRRHALILTAGDSANPFLAAKLISLYSSFRRPDLSTLVFLHSTPPTSRDAFLWNSLIQSHFSNSDFPLSLHFYRQMISSPTPPDQFTVPMAVSACAELRHIGFGSSVHAGCIKVGLLGASGPSLVYMYSKCGFLGDAFIAFDEMPKRDVVSWTAFIVGCVNNGESELGLEFLKEMHRVGERPSSRTMEGGLQACGSLEGLREGRCLHGFAVKIGVECCCSVKSMLLSVYSKCGCPEEALRAFQELSERDVVAWTSVVGVYARRGLIGECLELFREMVESGTEPDGVLLSCLLMGFANSSSVYGGKAFHGVILRRYLELGKVVNDSLLSMYCKLELLDDALKIFHLISDRDWETWNLMIFGCGKKGSDTKCLDLFREMQFLGFGIHADINGLVSVISSCSQIEALLLGQSVHCYSMKNRNHGDPSISNSLVGMYGRCGRLELARRIFDRTSRDVVTWNALISANVHMGHSNDALSLFDDMLLEGVKPNSTTLASVLSACSHMAALQKGKWIHDYIREVGLEFDISLSTALIDMYAKCGKPKTSRLLFDAMLERDVVTYNVMISAYGIHGNAEEALDVFEEMERRGERPNGVTFLALLSACSHGGLVEEGKSLFLRMEKYNLRPTLKHYACMVDLLGRSGKLSEAEQMVLSMPIEPDGVIWGALLGACNIHTNVEMGERIAKMALASDPQNDGYYVLMSNMYGCFRRWEEVERLRGLMKSNGVRKSAGWSSVELEGRVHVFVVGENSHPQSVDISMVLEALGRKMEEWS